MAAGRRKVLRDGRTFYCPGKRVKAAGSPRLSAHRACSLLCHPQSGHLTGPRRTVLSCMMTRHTGNVALSVVADNGPLLQPIGAARNLTCEGSTDSAGGRAARTPSATGDRAAAGECAGVSRPLAPNERGLTAFVQGKLYDAMPPCSKGPIASPARSSPMVAVKAVRSRDGAAGPAITGQAGGDARNRTGIDGFAGRCVTIPPRRRTVRDVAIRASCPLAHQSKRAICRSLEKLMQNKIQSANT